MNLKMHFFFFFFLIHNLTYLQYFFLRYFQYHLRFSYLNFDFWNSIYLLKYPNLHLILEEYQQLYWNMIHFHLSFLLKMMYYVK